MAKLPQISIHSAKGTPAQTALAAPLRKILKLLKIKDCRWSILLVGDREMQKLHQQYLSDPTTTDVLTFDLRDKPQKSTVHLDTVLCTGEARRRAAQLGHSLENELLLYALHSLLHVQGYNDTTPAQSTRMHRREDQLLTRIGIGPIYHLIAPKTRTPNPKTRNSKLETRNSPPRRSA